MKHLQIKLEKTTADFLKVLPNSAQDNIISFLQRSDQSIDFSRVLRAFVASSAKLQLHLRLMRETFHFLLPNKGKYSHYKSKTKDVKP